MFSNFSRNTTPIHKYNATTNLKQPRYPSTSKSGLEERHSYPSITERYPVYCMNWQPATPSDQKTWEIIQEGFEQFHLKILNSFRAAGYSRSAINIRNFGRRSISVRRFSDYPAGDVVNKFNEFNYNGDTTEGLFGATIELIDKSQKQEMPRFCDGLISGRTPILSDQNKLCIVDWSTDPSLFVSVDVRNVEHKEN